MVGIWTNSGDGWELDAPQPFQDEATLHHLILENPNLLPLAGSPRLTVLGSQVRLGNGYADILAVEPTGRPAIIEVKLAKNPEARKEIVSQILAYAAFLQGMSVQSLEKSLLRKGSDVASSGSILGAVQKRDQEGAVDADTFTGSLQNYLDQGNFRLVLVLDVVSAELQKIAAYLDSITVHALTIDVIALSIYDVNGAKVALPQRVTPDPEVTPILTGEGGGRISESKGELTDGSEVFEDSVAGISGEERVVFDELIDWAKQIALLPRVGLFTFTGVAGKRITLLPRIVPGDAGLVTIWNDNSRPAISVWRSVFDRLAPDSIESVEQAIAPTKIGQGNTLNSITTEVLKTLKAAYEEAAAI